MLKKFLYLLIIAFTFQVSWAMASAYCMHESGKASQHFGHHQHQHHTAGGADKDHSSTPKKAAFHPDCASCAHGSLATHSTQIELVMPLLSGYQTVSVSPTLPAPYLGQPERPQWRVAA